MSTLLQDSIEVDYIPTTEDLSDYHAWSLEVERSWWDQQVEARDRRETQEMIRREDFDNARSAACRIRGIAAALRAQGLDSAARQLLAASQDVLNLVNKYA